MSKTFPNVLSTLTLQFENPILENEYISFNTRRILDKPWAYLINIITVQLFLLLASLDFFSLSIKIVQFGLLISTGVLFLQRNKLQKYIEATTSIIPCLATIVGLTNLGLQVDRFLPVNLFFQGLALAAVSQVLVIWPFRFKFVLFTNIISMACRLGVFIYIAKQTGHCYIVELSFSIISDFICLHSIFARESHDRKVFRQHYSYSIESPDPKTQLLWKHMPQSVLVVSQNLKTGLFTNDNFMKTFGHDEPLRRFQKALEALSVYKDDFDSQKDLENLFESNSSLSLYDFLLKAMKKQKVDSKTITTYAFYQDPLKKCSKFFEVNISKLKWDNTDAILIVLSDITFQKEQLTAKIADAGKDKLIKTVSHELKTPIHGILSMLTLGLQSTKDPEVISVFEFCRKNTLILLNFVQSLVDLQLVRSNRLKLKPSRVHIETIIKEVTALFELHRSQKGITLIYEIADDAPKYMYTDSERLSEVLVNLVGNAVKFTHKGGISIKVKPGPDNGKNTTLFEVEDTGVGLSEEDHSRIFKMYGASEEGHDHSVVHGAGLGLTISNYLVKYLNNHLDQEGIKCISEYNKGSTFSFTILNDLAGKNKPRDSTSDDFSHLFENIEDNDLEARMSMYKRTAEPSRRFDNSMTNLSGFYDNDDRLPLRRGSAKIPSPLSSPSLMSPTPSMSSPTFSRRKESRAISVVVTPPKPSDSQFKKALELNEWVLLVDDNPLNLLVAKKLLEGTGCQVQTAIHGKDAIDKVKQHVESGVEFFKLIIMDCQMPVMDGYEATTELKAMMEKGDIPECEIVALTANDTEEDILRCKDCGMSDVFSKPLKENSIQKIVDILKKNSSTD